MNGRLIKAMKQISRRLKVVVMLMCFCIYSFGVGDGNEYNVKAMFILNFMKYVEWPKESDTGVFKIGIVGNSEIYDALISMTTNRQESRKIEIVRINPEDNTSCHIIFISHSEKHIEEWTKKYQGKGVLIISDENPNANAAINLLNLDNKIRFEINNTQAKLGGIKISSRLAELAVAVHQ